MDITTALALVNKELVFAPGWEVSASDHSHRFADTICVHFNLVDAAASERAHAPDYAVKVPGGARSQWPIYVGDITEPTELVGRVLDAAIANVTHELREFARLAPANVAPFHPHRHEGITAWAERTGSDPARDYLFGLA